MGNHMPNSKCGSILVVDDDPDVLETTSLLLKEFGYDVSSSSDPAEAIDRVQSNNIDVVVTDIVMPQISGIKLLEKVHKIDPRTPVILMTAYADMEKVIDALKQGAFDFIIKPFSLDLLVHSVQKAVDYNRMVKMEKEYNRLLEEFNQEIESVVSERTMSLMALTIADKIRNPASVIGLTCRRILEKEQVPEKLKPKLQDIMSEAEKLNSIVEHFHCLLKGRKSMFKYEDISGIVERVISVIGNTAAARGIEIVFKPAAHPLMANVQKNLFSIAISHLIKNSLEATPERSRIFVSTYVNHNNIVLSVSDTGTGMSSEVIENIFDPMFSTKEKRFGMGLPLVKRIMDEHMGHIEVESKPGEGTTFIVSLPLRWTGEEIERSGLV
jgi:signal transduction histidine kinase